MNDWPDTASPLPWTYHNDGNGHDWIEDANSSTVVEHIGHIDGPAICAAVNGPPALAASASTPVTDAQVEKAWRSLQREGYVLSERLLRAALTAALSQEPS